jgi:AcrR family transcriptional regulator
VARTSAKTKAPRVDRRVERSQRTLHEALLAIAHERDWDEITILGVCERANVGRSTFYAHFADKEELLVSGFPRLRDELRAHVASAGGRPLAFVEPLLEHARAHWYLVRLVAGDRSSTLVHRRFVEVVSDLLGDEVGARVPSGPRRGATLRALGGALAELVAWWVESRSPIPASEVAAIFVAIAQPSLDALYAGAAAR